MKHDDDRLYDELVAELNQQTESGRLTVSTISRIAERLFSQYGFRSTVPTHHTPQILVLRLDELGDVVLTSAFFRELRRNHPLAFISVVVKPECKELLRHSPYINQVESLDTAKLQPLGRQAALMGLVEFARQVLWKRRFDLCISPRYDYDRYMAGLLGLFSGAAQRIGYAENTTPWKQNMNRGYNAFYTKLLPGEGILHEVERNLSVLRMLGGKVVSSRLEAWTDAREERWAADALNGVAMPIAAISPGRAESNRFWSVERYVQLADWLFQSRGMSLLVLGSTEEAATANAIAEQTASGVINFCGKTSVGQMTALLRHCRIYIGRDTSVMHLAAAVGVPVVEISACPVGEAAEMHFSSPKRFGPWGVPHRVLQPQQANMDCKGGCRAPEPHCILRVSVSEVQQAIHELLSLPEGKANQPVMPQPTDKRQTWTRALQRFSDSQAELKKTDPAAAMIAADQFFLEHLKKIQPKQAMSILPALMEVWMLNRRLPHRFGSVPKAEMDRFLEISSVLKMQIRYLLLNHDIMAFGAWTERQQQQLVNLWRILLISFFSPEALKGSNSSVQHAGSRLQDYLVRSLFTPTPAGENDIPVGDLLAGNAPAFLKTIFCAWLVGTPYFGVVAADRDRACRYAEVMCKELTRPTPWLSFGAFAIIMEEMMASFWRISYAGGDCSRELSILGDFISFHMNRFFPQEKLSFRRKAAGQEVLKIGYISRNFCKQAVSFYMVNRVIHHDHSRFHLHTFLAGERDDELSEVFRQHSDSHSRHAQLTDLPGIIKSIRDQELDILVFADLGMDPLTLMLAGLRLAPVQCVLVGHGVTSGMPNVDYYLSGDFEPEDAQRYYREKLIRLPRLGAAQYPPYIPDKLPTRQEYKIPEDAIVFVTCANGIKIHPDQDRLFLEILQRVPNAWLVLKPFQTPDAVDYRFIERFFAPARALGLADRILIVPPFKQAKDVLGLLAIADIQLDTYPYGGWTTNMEAVYMGLPIVTQVGDMARSRWGACMLALLGLSEGVARNEREYVDWAVRFGTDHQLRERVRSMIKEKAVSAFFDGQAAQAAYEEVLLACYEEKCARSS